jgi:pyruvate ferredoxin oxidoreductase gamma subunit
MGAPEVHGGPFQLRIHGRGGQGVVTAAEVVSVAAFIEHRHAQAFPTFGSERMGAPVTSFCRISDHRIRVREPVSRPDAVIVQDPTLLHQVDVFGGLRESGYALLNSSHGLQDLGLTDLLDRFDPSRLLTVPASEIARDVLGRPIANAALLGAFSALTGVVSIESVCAAIEQKFHGKLAERNVLAARRCNQVARSDLKEPAGA